MKVLTTQKVLDLYKKGFFPMAESAESAEINFYKPNMRFIIPIELFHIPKKLHREYKKQKFKFLINTDFSSVINNCSKSRKGDNNTWINTIIKNIYIKLHKENFAKSIECFQEDKLIGGLYGIHLGGCFFGESMFSNVKDTSKLCLLYLISILKKHKFSLLDSQFYNSHLIQFGAHEISDREYQKKLNNGLKENCFFPNEFNYYNSLSTLHSLTHKS